MSTTDNIIGKITPRPPERLIGNRFWVWLQEQIEKIRDSLDARAIAAFQSPDANSIPAGAGPHSLETIEIEAGAYRANQQFTIVLEAFGFFANTANTKDFIVEVQGVSAFAYSGTAQNCPWRFTLELISRSGQLIASGIIFIDGLVPEVQTASITFDPAADDFLLEVLAESSAGAANDIRIDNLTLSSSKVQA